MNRCCCFILVRLERNRLGCRWGASEDACAPISKQSLHRIMSARTKWLASKQAPNCHSASAHSAVSFNCFARIFRTSRNKAARRRQPGRDYCFVKLQKRNQNKPHRLLLYSLSLWERVRVRVLLPPPHEVFPSPAPRKHEE